jgi:hypothetical protein
MDDIRTSALLSALDTVKIEIAVVARTDKCQRGENRQPAVVTVVRRQLVRENERATGQ